jgi:septal ring factor EnvC (AmiA/AmiB activator)
MTRDPHRAPTPRRTNDSRRVRVVAQDSRAEASWAPISRARAFRAQTYAVACLALWIGSPVARAQDRMTRHLQREAGLQHELKTAHDALAKAEHRVASLSREDPVLSYRIAEVDRQVTALRHRVERRREAARKWARLLYRLTRGGYVRLMASSTNRPDTLFRKAMVGHILRREVSEVETQAHAIAALQRLRQQLRHRQERQLSQLQSLRLRQRKLEQRRARLAREVARARAERPALLRSAPALNDQQRALLQQVERAQRQRQQRSASIGSLQGRIPWPTASRQLIGAFGRTRDSRTGLVVNQSGITIRCRTGEAVRAVHPGIVRRTETVRGLRQVVLLEHAGRWFTLYGALEQTRVQAGQRIERGTPIGRAGHDTLGAGSALYFELRRGRYPLDPLDWLAKATPRGR